MPLNPDRRKIYDAKRHRDKQQKKNTQKKIYFPMRISENVLAAANHIAAKAMLQGTYPWRSTADVLRALLGLGLKQLAEDGDDDASGLMPLIEAESQLSDVSRTRRHMINLLELTKTEVGEMVRIGAHDEATTYYSSILDTIARLPETTWSNWLNIEVRAAFPELQKRVDEGDVPGIKLNDRKKWQRQLEKRKTPSTKAQSARKR